MEKGEHTVIWILLLGLGIFMSLIYDHTLLRYIQSTRSQLLNFYFIQFSLWFTVPVIIILVTIFLLKKKKVVIPWWVASITTLAFTLTLKFLLARERPYFMYDDIMALTKESIIYTFPSVRTAVAFSALPFINKYFKKYTGFWIIFALLVAYSRVYLGVHFVSDVIAGMLTGYLLGKMVLLTSEKTKKF